MVLAGAARLATAQQHPVPYQPAGFGPAAFGMGLMQVWKLFPLAKLMSGEEQLGAPLVAEPYVDRLELRDQSVTGLDKPTTVELRFWKDQLWSAVVYFGDNDVAQVKAFLEKTFGRPVGSEADHPTWPGPRVTTTAVYSQKWYASSLNDLSQEADAWQGDMLKGTWKGETPEEEAARQRRMRALTPAPGALPPTAVMPTAVAP